MLKPSSEKGNSALKSKRNLKLEERSESITNITHTSQRNHKVKKYEEIKHLNLDYFKSIPCNIGVTHNHKNCVFFHNPKDRRRPGSFYSSQLCKSVQEGKKCSSGDQCLNAHSRVEQLYRSDTYKTKFCSHYPNNIETCEYKQFCSFAHSQDQILIQLIHNLDFDDDFYMFSYKTVFCPFNLTEHDKALCVYAHNWQDFRRKPSLYMYQPVACPEWQLKGFVSDYAVQGCPRSFGCHLCHGWKETKKCPTSMCKKGQCHFYHNQKQKRSIDQDVQNHIFRIVPRYRITQGTFKHDYNTGFKVKQRKQKQQQQKLSHKDNTVVIFKNTCIIEEKSRSKTTVNIDTISTSISEQTSGKWISEAEVYESEGQQAQQDVNDQVQKLINVIGNLDCDE